MTDSKSLYTSSMNTTARFNAMHDAHFSVPEKGYTSRDDVIEIMKKDEEFAWKYRICEKWLDSPISVQKKHRVAHLCKWIEWQIDEYNT